MLEAVTFGRTYSGCSDASGHVQHVLQQLNKRPHLLDFIYFCFFLFILQREVNLRLVCDLFVISFQNTSQGRGQIAPEDRTLRDLSSDAHIGREIVMSRTC